MRINPDLDFYLGSDSDLNIKEEVGSVVTSTIEPVQNNSNQQVIDLLTQLNNRISTLESTIESMARNNNIENNLRVMKEYKVWFVYREDKQHGPYSMQQIMEGIRTNRILTTDKVWCMQLGSPQIVSDCKYLRTT